MADEKMIYPVQPAPLMPPQHPQTNQFGAPQPVKYNPQGSPNAIPNYTQPGYVMPTVIVGGVPRLTTSPQHLSNIIIIIYELSSDASKRSKNSRF